MPKCIVIGSKYKSLNFNGTSSYLSMSDADFGAFTYSKFSISLWFNTNNTASTRSLYGKMNGVDRCFEIQASNSISVNTYHGGDANTVNGNTTFLANTWNHILVHVDPTNATPANRLKFWINGAAETYSSTDYSANTAVNDSSADVTIGALGDASSFFDGKIYQPAFFDNTLVPIASVYNAGVIRDITGVAGLYSLINTANNNITDDYVLSTNWTNNNSVVLSNSKP